MSALGVSVIVLGSFTAPAAPPVDWEASALSALTAGDGAALRALAADFQKLTPDERRKLPLRVRADAVEFAVRGEHPGDQDPGKMLEYLVAVPGKDYEALLVAPAAELRRVQALRPFFLKHSEEGRRTVGLHQWWSARLAWVEDGVPQSADVADLAGVLTPGERERFLDNLGIIPGAGFGGDINIQADPAVLPQRRVAAVLYVTLRLNPDR
jgi:hypothetical protein